MHTQEIQMPQAGRWLGRYSDEFKRQVIAACLEPGVSTAAIALANGHACAMRAVRQATLDAAFRATPKRFKGVNPCLAPMPIAVWINPPTPEVQTNTQHCTVNL